MSTKKLCTIGLWNEDIPGISFDQEGVSNYAKIQYSLMETYPRGSKGKADWDKIVSQVKKKGRNNQYDCIVGVSGGVDSSYLLYLLKVEYGLRPLAVTLDNGWSSDIAVNNIKLITNALAVDLETHVIDYEEIKDLIRSYIYSGLPWIDTPTDTAIQGVMYNVALKLGIKYIFRGNDFRTEGKQPREWTYSDDRQLRFIHHKFGKKKRLKTFPYLSFLKTIYAGFIRGIKDIRPYYYLDYSKYTAKDFLEKEFGWKDYGGHHHENVFTKFVMACWLPEKFKIDKRVINLSAQILSGYLNRKNALQMLESPALNEEQKRDLRKYVIKKLDFTEQEFSNIMSSENRSYRDYPNLEKRFFFIIKYFSPLIRLVYPQKPMAFVEMEMSIKPKTNGAIIIEGHVQGLSNTRSLGESGIPVYVIDKANCLARYSKYCTKFYRCPDFLSDEFALFLISLARKENIKNWVLIPSNDHAVYTISRFKNELEKYYKVITPGIDVIENIYDKSKLLDIAVKCNVPIPKTQYYNKIDSEISESLNFPVITKGKNGLSFFKTVHKKAFLANDRDELNKQLLKINESFPISGVFTQELIPYNGLNKTISCTAFCESGIIKAHWMGEKLREHPLRFGTATLARSTFNHECLNSAITLIKELDYTGVCEIEFLFDPLSGQYKLIEMNPRTWLWVGLAKECGVDYAKMIFNYTNGLKFNYPNDYLLQVKWVNYLTDTLMVIKALFMKKIKFSEYLISMKGKKVKAIFSINDPLPGLILGPMSLYLAGKRKIF